MTTLLVNAVVRPHRLFWWQWGQVLGLVLPILLFYTGILNPLAWALAVHLFIDFTVQSDATSLGKRQRNWKVIAYHSFISGGYPGLIVGGVPGMVVSAAVHFLIDATNKFGLKQPLGPILDQAAHIGTIVAIWWLFN